MQTHVIPFREGKILAFSRNGEKFVAIKPICQALGLDWSAQLQRIKRDPLFESVMVIITTTGSDGKRYDMVTMMLEYFPMWLAKIQADRVKDPNAREKIIVYQKEAVKALYSYFFGKRENADTINLEKEKYIRLLEKHVELLEELQKPKTKRRKVTPISEEEKQKIIELARQGFSYQEIARQTKRSTASVSFIVRSAK